MARSVMLLPINPIRIGMNESKLACRCWWITSSVISSGVRMFVFVCRSGRTCCRPTRKKCSTCGSTLSKRRSELWCRWCSAAAAAPDWVSTAIRRAPLTKMPAITRPVPSSHHFIFIQFSFHDPISIRPVALTLLSTLFLLQKLGGFFSDVSHLICSVDLFFLTSPW